MLGRPVAIGAARFNAASVLRCGKVERSYFKNLLPNYEVFDEERYFEAGVDACVFDLRRLRLGVSICADIWEPVRPRPRGPPARRCCYRLTHRPIT